MISSGYRARTRRGLRSPTPAGVAHDHLGVLKAISRDFWSPIDEAGRKLGRSVAEDYRASGRTLRGAETAKDKELFAPQKRSLGILGDLAAAALSPAAGAFNVGVAPASRALAASPIPVYEDRGPFKLPGERVLDPASRAKEFASSMNLALMGLAPGKTLAAPRGAALPARYVAPKVPQVLNETRPAAHQPEVMGGMPSPETSPAPRALWEMDRKELQGLFDEVSLGDKEKLAKAFGNDEATVAEFNRLQRAMNNTWDTQRADAASAEFDAKFGRLSPEQERLIYGVGETDASADDIRALLSAHDDVLRGDPADWLSYQAGVAARGTSPEGFSAVLKGGGTATDQANFVRMRRAYDELAAQGAPASEMPRRMAEGLVSRGGWSPEQANEVIGEFVSQMVARGGQRPRAANQYPQISAQAREGGR